MIFTGRSQDEFGQWKKHRETINIEKARKMIFENLERPSFKYEDRNAYAAFKEVYGVDYASPSEMKTLADKEEIERLREKVEQLEIEKREAKRIADQNGTTTVPDTPQTGESSTQSGVMSKDEYAIAHPELKGLPLYHAYNKYVKEKG